MSTLSKLVFNYTLSNQAKSLLIEGLQQKMPTKARAGLQSLLYHLNEKPAPKQTMHFHQSEHRQLATALNHLDATHKEFLFNDPSVSVTPNYLKQLFSFDSTLQALAKYLKAIKFDALQASRDKKGMQHYLIDLKDSRHDRIGLGWSMQRGLLAIQPQYFKNKTTQSEIHDYLSDIEQLGNKSWYEKPEDRNPSDDLSLYDISIKTLGKNGINPAVDPIFILKTKQGTLKVLCGTRQGGYALPGGMQEASVKETCINELLEECFSGALFEPDSNSEAKLNAVTLTPEERNVFTQKVIQHTLYQGQAPKQVADNYEKLNQQHLARLAKASQQAVSLVDIPNHDLNNSQYLSSVINHIRTSTELKEGEKAPIIAHLKCEYYKTYLSKQYKRFQTMVTEKMHTRNRRLNLSDPRNTNYAYMYTTPVDLIIDENELTQFLEKECDLIFGAGDDLAKVQYRPIDVFANNITDEQVGVYSDHASLVIETIRLGIQRGELVVDTALLAQIKTITDNNVNNPKLQKDINRLNSMLTEPSSSRCSIC